MILDVIEDIDDPIIPINHACNTLAVSRATLYRHTMPANPPSYATRPPCPRKLTEGERLVILDVLHSEPFMDQPPPEVYATLLSQGVYLASIRTMYRILAKEGENAERRTLRAPARHVKPTLTATAPNQVWTWDITKLRSVVPGTLFCLYVIIDLFSRMVVGWLLAERENGAHAERLFTETIAKHGVAPGLLTVHADRGSPMKSENLAQLFALLGVTRSFSRPHVSDDNAFSEAQFKTLKYQPDYPNGFASQMHARAWCQEFFAWFNDEHHHSGIALFTPADVFNGRIEEVTECRQTALNDAYKANPGRFPNGPPIARRPPEAVHINPLHVNDETLEVMAGNMKKTEAAHAAAKTPRREPQDPEERTRNAPHPAAMTPRREAQATAANTLPS